MVYHILRKGLILGTVQSILQKQYNYGHTPLPLEFDHTHQVIRLESCHLHHYISQFLLQARDAAILSGEGRGCMYQNWTLAMPKGKYLSKYN